MLRLLKALPVALAIAALSIVATSCSSNNGTKARFVNAIWNTSNYGGTLDVEVNGTQQFTGVTFASASASTYTPIPSGNVTFEGFESPGVTIPVFTDSTTLNSGTEYTEVATGLAGGSATGGAGSTVMFLSFSDDNTAPANTTLNFRVINASPNSPAVGVDIWIEAAPFNSNLPTTPTISALAYQSASGYVNVPYNTGGGGFTMFVHTAGSGPFGTNLIPPDSISVNGGPNSGAVCTLVLTDCANEDCPLGFTMNPSPIFLNDNNC